MNSELLCSLLILLVINKPAKGVPCLVGGWNGTNGSSRCSLVECWSESAQEWVYDLALTTPYAFDRAAPMDLGLPCLVGGMNETSKAGYQVICLNISNPLAPWTVYPNALPDTVATTCTGTSASNQGAVINGVGGVPLKIAGLPVAVGGSHTPYDYVHGDPRVVQWRGLSTPLSEPGALINLPNELNEGRVIPAAFHLNGSICVAGGLNDTDGCRSYPLDSTECMDPQTGLWHFGPELSRPRGAHLSLQINGWWCMLGGGSDFSCVENSDYTIDCLLPPNRAYLHPPPANELVLEWQEVSIQAPTALYLSAAFNIGELQCVGGRGDPTVPGEVYCLNTTIVQEISQAVPSFNSSNPWMQLPSLLLARSAPSVLYVTWPTNAPTKNPTTLHPTFAPTTIAPTTAPTSTAPTISPTPEPVLTGSGVPHTGQVALVIDVGLNGTGTLSPSQALFIISTIFANLNLTLPSNLAPKISVSSPSTAGASNTVSITLLLDDNGETGQIGTAIKQNPDVRVPGYNINAVTLNWPSVLLALQGLTRMQALILFLVLLLVLLLIVLLHWRQKALNHLPCLFGVATSLFSFSSHAWFLATLAGASFSASATPQIAQERRSFLPFLIAFTVAFVLPVMSNITTMSLSLRKVRQRDPDFQAWTRAHKGTYSFGVLLSLFGLGNLGIVSSPVWGWKVAPMSKTTRASLGALGLWASVLEVPRLAVQVALAAIKTASAAAAVIPLLLGSVFLATGFIQRCYFYGYTKNKEVGTEFGLYNY